MSEGRGLLTIPDTTRIAEEVLLRTSLRVLRTTESASSGIFSKQENYHAGSSYRTCAISHPGVQGPRRSLGTLTEQAPAQCYEGFMIPHIIIIITIIIMTGLTRSHRRPSEVSVSPGTGPPSLLLLLLSIAGKRHRWQCPRKERALEPVLLRHRAWPMKKLLQAFDTQTLGRVSSSTSCNRHDPASA